MPSFVGFVQLSLCSARVPCVPRRLQGPQGMDSFEGIDFPTVLFSGHISETFPPVSFLPAIFSLQVGWSTLHPAQVWLEFIVPSCGLQASSEMTAQGCV